MNGPIVYFDEETDGLDDDAQIIQLAAVAVSPEGDELDSIDILLDFDITKSNAEALELNHFDPERWKQYASTPFIAVKRFAWFLNRFRWIPKVGKSSGKAYTVAQLSGFNAAAFDMPRLQRLFKQHDHFLPADYKTLDVMHLALWYFEFYPHGKPDSMRLETLCEFFNIEYNAHDALEDARATARLREALRANMIENWSIDSCMNRMRRVRQDAENKHSLEPVREFFKNLQVYVKRHNPDKTALGNWGRMHSLWDSHFEPWYLDFQQELEQDGTTGTTAASGSLPGADTGR